VAPDFGELSRAAECEIRYCGFFRFRRLIFRVGQLDVRPRSSRKMCSSDDDNRRLPGDPSAEAAAWVSRREGGAPIAPAEEAAFQRWLEADPRNAREYAIVAALFARSGEPVGEAHRPRRFRAVGIAAAAAAALVLVSLVLWTLSASFEGDYRTRVGELREIPLPDGSVLTLDTDSAARVRFRREERLVILEAGRALFAVAEAHGRPFVVRTPVGEVRVTGTVFEVAYLDRATRVAVGEGEVRLKPGTEAAGATPLRGGEQVLLADDGTVGAVEAVDTESFASWQAGRLIFRDRPLGEVAREVGRYLNEDVHVATAELRKRPISGVFETERIDAFFAAVRQMLPVRVRRAPDGRILIEPED